jgi:creatinine amidohydrolase
MSEVPMPPRAVLWQKLRRGEVQTAAAAGGLVLLPIGAVEQHGPHLPLDTDSITAFAICGKAAELVQEFPILVLPPIWWGLSPYWMAFPGTLTLAPETLLALIADLAGSVAAHGFQRLIVVNGHGGNDGLIQAAAVKATVGRLQVAAVSYWSLIRDVLQELSERDGGDIGHAGELETSIQLHLQPQSVRLSEVTPRQCLDLREYAAGQEALPGNAYVPPNPGAESPHGVYGFAPAGTPDKGRRIVESAAARLAELARRFRAVGPS